MTLQDEETPIDQEIANEVVARTPETWHRAVLEVAYSCDNNDERFEHMIYSPDGHRDLVEPSDLIYSATFRLQQLFQKYAGSWKKATYVMTVEDDGIKYKVTFEPGK